MSLNLTNVNNFQSALKAKSFHKLIIGAALKDFKLIENFSYIFTHAQVNALDISAFPNSVIYAKKGIEKALHENPNLSEPLLMISVNIGEDPHFRRIVLNVENCTECLACIPSCPADAFYQSPEANFNYDIDLCYGCGNCLPDCHFTALDYEHWNSQSPESISNLIELGANAIEIHLNNDLDLFHKFYKQVPKSFLLESFCIGSEKMNQEDLENASSAIINAVINKHGYLKPFIIQTDGIPLAGARWDKSANKDLISIKNAEIVIKKINAEFPQYAKEIFVQLAGGVTEHSLEKAFKENVQVNGVAIGSYVRKIIHDSYYKENTLDTQEAIIFARDLINTSKTLGEIIKI